MLSFLKKDTKKKSKKKAKKRTRDEPERKEIVVKIPVPEVKKPELFKKKVERAIISVNLPTLYVRVRMDGDNLYIDNGLNAYTLSTITISKEELMLKYKKMSVSRTWVHKSQELDEYYVRGRGYLIGKFLAQEFAVGRNKRATAVVEIWFGKFNGKYPRLGKRGKLEGTVDFEERPAHFLVVVEQNIIKNDARSQMPIMMKNVYFRLAVIPQKYRDAWEGFEKKKEDLPEDETVFKVEDESSLTSLGMDAYEEDEEEEEGGFGGGFLGKIFKRGREEDEEEEEKEGDEEEDESWDDLPDIGL